MGSMEDVIQMRRDSFPSQGSQKRRRVELNEIATCADHAIKACPDGNGFIECFRGQVSQRMAHMSESDIVSFSYSMYSTLQEKVTLEIQDDIRRKDARQIEKYGELTTRIQFIQHELLVFLGKTSSEDLRVRNLENIRG